MPFAITSVCVAMLSFALWVKETHTWLLSRSILIVLIWAYTSFTRNYRSSTESFCVRSVNHDHANALITWAAWLVYSSIVELTPDTFPDSLGVVISILSVVCVIISIQVENERHSKKDGLRRTDWIVLQTTRGLFVGLLFIPHRSTLFSLGALYAACVSVLFFVNFAIASMSTDMDQRATLYVDCKLMQSVWVLVGDIRVTAVVMPYVLFKLNKIRWLKTGDGWEQHESTESHVFTDAESPPPVLTSISIVNTEEKHTKEASGAVPESNNETFMKLQQAIAQREKSEAIPSVQQSMLFSSPSEHISSNSQKASLISHLQAVSKSKNNNSARF